MEIWQNFWTIIFAITISVYVAIAIYIAWGGASDIRDLFRQYSQLDSDAPSKNDGEGEEPCS